MNNIQLIKSLVNSKNPLQAMQVILGNNNPMFNNLMQMAQTGNTKGLETFARNYCKERNIDFDKEFNNFKKNFQ